MAINRFEIVNHVTSGVSSSLCPPTSCESLHEVTRQSKLSDDVTKVKELGDLGNQSNSPFVMCTIFHIVNGFRK